MSNKNIVLLAAYRCCRGNANYSDVDIPVFSLSIHIDILITYIDINDTISIFPWNVTEGLQRWVFASIYSLQDGRESLVLGHIAGQPVTTIMGTMINTVAAVVRNDRHLRSDRSLQNCTFQSPLFIEFWLSIWRHTVYVPYGSYICCRRNKGRFEWKFVKNGSSTNCNRPNFFDNFFTCDISWVHYFDPLNVDNSYFAKKTDQTASFSRKSDVYA